MIDGSQLWAGLRSVRASSRRKLAVVASGSIGWRLVPETLRSIPFVDDLTDSVATSLAVGSIPYLGEPVWIVGFFLQIGLFYFLLSLLVPNLFREPSFTPLRDDALFGRLVIGSILAVVVVANFSYGFSLVDILISGSQSDGSGSHEVFLFRIAGLVVLVTSLLAAFIYFRWWTDEGGNKRYQPLNSLPFVGNLDVGREYFSQSDSIGREIRQLSWVFIGGLSLTVVALALGLALTLAGTLFPLPEIVILASLGLEKLLNEKAFKNRDVGEASTNLFDIESRFPDVVISAVSTWKGSMSLALIFSGIASSVLFVLFAILSSLFGFLLLVQYSTPGELLMTHPFRLSNYVGLIVLLLVLPGVFGFLFWHRIFTRLPHFLRHRKQKQRPSRDREVADSDQLPIPRLSIELFVPTIGFGVAYLYLHGLILDSVSPDSLIFTVSWIGIVALALWTLHRLQNAAPQSLSYDGIWMMIALGLHIGWLMALFSLPPMPNLGIDVPIIVWLYTSISWLYFSPDIQVFSDNKSGPASHLTWVMLVGLGLAWIALSMYGQFLDSIIFFTGVAMTMAGGIVIGVRIWYSQELISPVKR